ncbi:MAG: hypothetical protein ACYDD4_03535 [Acidimicrobiales bacterium]
MRERRPGMWEIRVAVGADPVSGRTVQRSFLFYGGAEEATLGRQELAHEWVERRAIRRSAPSLTVGELLDRWIGAHHDWRPATWIGARSNVRALRADRLAQRRVTMLTPDLVHAAMASWVTAGASVAVVSGRFRVLRSALGWAHVERIVDINPLAGMRGPTRPGTRLHLTHDEVVRLLTTSERLAAEAAGGAEETPFGWTRLHRAEQMRLLVRLAADSGARRGELVALRTGDLDGRVLTIERGVRPSNSGPRRPAAPAA